MVSLSPRRTALAYHSVFDDKSLAFLSPWGFRMLALLRTAVRLTKEKPDYLAVCMVE